MKEKTRKITLRFPAFYTHTEQECIAWSMVKRDTLINACCEAHMRHDIPWSEDQLQYKQKFYNVSVHASQELAACTNETRLECYFAALRIAKAVLYQFVPETL